jgi:hypothetical protein
MTDTDWHAFTLVMDRLALACNTPTDNTLLWTEKCREYFAVFADVTLADAGASADYLKREGSGFFPSAREWLAAAHDIAHERDQRLSGSLGPALPYLDCEVCGDTGWRYCECPDEPCGRPECPHAHTFVVPCCCRATNQHYQRKLVRQQAIAQERVSRGRRE